MARRLRVVVAGTAVVVAAVLAPAVPVAAQAGLVGPTSLGQQTTEPSGPGRIGEPPGGGRATTEPERSTTTEPTSTTESRAPKTTSTTEADRDDGGASRSNGAVDLDDDDDDGTSIVALVGVGALGLVLGVLLAAVPLGMALARRKRPAAPGSAGGAVPGPGPTGPVPAAPAPSVAPGGLVVGPPPSRDEVQARSQRAALADALMSLRDQLPSEALSDEVARALAAAGIVEVRPDGQPFDPARHRAVDQIETDDPARHGTVVSTERPGYVDGDRIVRLPEVVVARHGEAPS